MNVPCMRSHNSMSRPPRTGQESTPTGHGQAQVYLSTSGAKARLCPGQGRGVAAKEFVKYAPPLRLQRPKLQSRHSTGFGKLVIQESTRT